MNAIRLERGELPAENQDVLTTGFNKHSEQSGGPRYCKERINWLIEGEGDLITGALTADLLWNWLYIDELWTDESIRGLGYGKRLMNEAENFAHANKLSGIWLWTQSWQAAEFYQHMGFQEFTRFPDFPEGHFRIGFRKQFINRKR
jgi:GNAT superfamily N-acetyltransferase